MKDASIQIQGDESSISLHTDVSGQCQSEFREGHQRRLEMCKILFSSAAAFGLEDCWSWKPVLDGKQVMSLLGISRPGPELGQAVSAVMEWQLSNPGGDVKVCQSYLAEKWGPGSNLKE